VKICASYAPRDGNVGHTVVEQVFRPQLGIDVDQHPVGGLPLAGMTRDRVTVVEVRILHQIEFDLAASVHLQTDPPILADALDGPQLAVGRFKSGDGAVSCTGPPTEKARSCSR
jgi:hypothetical protein